MEPFTAFKSHYVIIESNDIDTDQIIPARFLKVIDKSGLGDNLFCDWRYNQDGTPIPDFVLNKPEAKSAKILVAGDNFGCGSSREHAPWALVAFGFKAIVSTSFADIFRNNSLKNGLLPVMVESNSLQALFSAAKNEPGQVLEIDLAEQTISMPSGKVSFPIDKFSKECMLQGIDQLGYLQKHIRQIEDFEAKHPSPVNTLE